ncbi:MAG: hypothetical protein K2L07_11450 [Lachnospiraceae bacterium]|nr:hypothetical protein [Lachnospiraceae bacterium]
MNRKIYVAVFIIIISMPLIGMLWYQTDMTVEKRHARAFPSIWKEEKLNVEFFTELTDYFADNFAFRQELATVDAVIKTSLFHVSNNEKVIVGEDGWLYLGETKEDYLGRNTMSGRGIYNCAKVLNLLQEEAGKQGCQFLFVPVPNKNSLYPEYMPEWYMKQSTENNYSQLVKELGKQKVAFIDLKKEFSKKDNVLYHKLDTHWNNEGAAFAGGQILESLKKEHTDYTNENYRVVNNFSGDLWGMLYPQWKKLDADIIYDREHIFEYCNDVNTTEDMFIETKSQKDGSLVMFRDSFGNALLPFLADEYGEAYFTKAVPYNWNLLEQYGADTVVIELTERHIPSLQQEIPVMQGPERKLKGTMERISQSNTTLNIRKTENQYILYGMMDASYVEDNFDVFIKVIRDGKESIYEAFPAVYEMDGSEENQDYQYGIYLDENVIGTENCKLEVITGRSGKYYILKDCLIYKGEKGE